MPKSKKAKKKQIDLASLEIKCDVEIPPFKIQNVVSTFSLGVSGLNLKYIALKYHYAEFNPQTFAAATIRIRNPRTTALAFASGNMVITGASSPLLSRYAARKYVRIFQHVGIPVCMSKFRIQNIVASADVGFTLKLQDISNDYGPYCSYEPDLFPGLIFRSISPKLVFLCFRSGKIVITGGKNVQEIDTTYSSLFSNILVKYRDNDNATVSSSEYRNMIKNKRDLRGL